MVSKRRYLERSTDELKILTRAEFCRKIDEYIADERKAVVDYDVLSEDIIKLFGNPYTVDKINGIREDERRHSDILTGVKLKYCG